MSLLPKNERKVAKETPRNFVIYGGTMHGKTYFADEFPDPLNLNTDGNAEMIETPSINIGHKRDARGNIIKSASDLLSEIIVELEGTNHTFETVVVDVIDDIITLFEQEITEEHNVKSVGDIGWGKGHQMLEMMVRVFVMRLKELSMKKKMNIIYVSRLSIVEENDVETYIPSLKLKWLNIVNGNSDYTILCRKIGKNYIRKVESKRKNYTRDKVDDERIASLLDTVIGAYEKSKSTPTDKAKKMVEEQEKQQEAERKAKQAQREQEIEQEPKQEAKQEESKPTVKRPPRPVQQ
ncbi:AAA family ATPase [Halalkalibacterium halodurans]|uniref:AAA family ATPase n=1 Tax=Halalkalibacterium halodurans TaxID=86665 RepID=UPI002AAA4E85|nr:AAA family ATPase [Halalkalibacterium halodurans]MDY7224691.1 AAA family ATPase [Halalkalibacterium halodurans]MDY7243259.1 AAA family ATPase [Halalkalibacterium halodurans]